MANRVEDEHSIEVVEHREYPISDTDLAAINSMMIIVIELINKPIASHHSTPSYRLHTSRDLQVIDAVVQLLAQTRCRAHAIVRVATEYIDLHTEHWSNDRYVAVVACTTHKVTTERTNKQTNRIRMRNDSY
jgi:hypothetical protein